MVFRRIDFVNTHNHVGFQIFLFVSDSDGGSEENPVGLDNYLYPSQNAFEGDMFIIDGVARGVCALIVLLKSTKSDPIIVMHDWYPRVAWYSWAIQLFSRYERIGTTLVRLYK